MFLQAQLHAVHPQRQDSQRSVNSTQPLDQPHNSTSYVQLRNAGSRRLQPTVAGGQMNSLRLPTGALCVPRYPGRPHSSRKLPFLLTSSEPKQPDQLSPAIPVILLCQLWNEGSLMRNNKMMSWRLRLLVSPKPAPRPTPRLLQKGSIKQIHQPIQFTYNQPSSIL